MNRFSPSARHPVVNVICALLIACSATGTELRLPPRPPRAATGTEFIAKAASLLFAEREEAILKEITSGNVPGFLRTLVPVTVSSSNASVTFLTTPDYLAVGSDDDYLLVPISPMTAQKVADVTGCSLPTRKMVDSIYAAADLKLAPFPMKPGPEMVTISAFSNHNAQVKAQRKLTERQHPMGTLTAGHKKDIVLTPKLETTLDKVAIYGWHQTNGTLIQPLYLGHTARWVDYSHGVRLVQQELILDGRQECVSNVLANPDTCASLSDEGSLRQGRYLQAAAIGTNTAFADGATFAFTNNLVAESVAWAEPFPETKVYLNLPARTTPTSAASTLLIFYALPNGNTIEQTLGKTVKPGDDWHFGIQHILAQTRFLRNMCPARTIALACLQSAQLSWPTWRKKYGNDQIPFMLEAICHAAALENSQIVLSGHSGGGSLIFGFLNAVSNIPPSVVRIAFLDSNYAYDAQLGHAEKLVHWLKGANDRCLTVIAYNDAVALLNGKSFVSATGGTWGRSHAMQQDLAEQFQFSTNSDSEFKTMTSLNGRIQFILKENPERKILHTVQVEKNGFIHSLLCGTTNENRSYTYFGPRAYGKWISAD
ncbi:MAG TPA: hypothetical protein VN673_01125 [Clostridia bacterium]|nr:hypothetical protein [Clostridia bacterium]